MRHWKTIILAPAIFVAAACGRDDDRLAADSALNRDLNLANQVAPYQPVDSLSALESGVAPGGAARPAGTSARRTTSSPARTTTRRSTASSGARSTSGGTVSPGGTVSTSGGEVVQKNTKRDAAIGAVAGAAIGAATSRDKLKGAVIGGVVGGVIGGVIGNNVDVKRTKKP